MMFFPTSPNPRPADMNWSVVMYGFVTIILLVFYFWRARHFYDGPVKTVRHQLNAEASERVEVTVQDRLRRCALSWLQFFSKVRLL